MSETSAKKDVQKLQRAIVDGLEDVKAQDIRVFNTEHLSPLFERVIVASGTSNRQTKALAASVRDQVREAGFSKPRIEGEENGEWIIVDCGPAVVHIMQPSIRQYYNLEEIWGEKQVRLKSAAPLQRKGSAAEKEKAAGVGAKSASGAAKKVAAGKTAGTTTAAKKAPARKAPAKASGARSATGKAPARSPSAKAPARGAPGRSPAAKAPTRSAGAKPAGRSAVARAPAAKTGARTSAGAAKSTRTSAKPPAKAPAAKRPAARKASPR